MTVKPYVLLSQSRIETVTVMGRLLTYFIAFVTSLGGTDPISASIAMTNVQMAMLANVSCFFELTHLYQTCKIQSIELNLNSLFAPPPLSHPSHIIILLRIS